jgi:hypothetical protein
MSTDIENVTTAFTKMAYNAIKSGIRTEQTARDEVVRLVPSMANDRVFKVLFGPCFDYALAEYKLQERCVDAIKSKILSSL